MTEDEVRQRAFAMPLHDPAFRLPTVHIVADPCLPLGSVAHAHLAR